jgi:hypothetical protein
MAAPASRVLPAVLLLKKSAFRAVQPTFALAARNSRNKNKRFLLRFLANKSLRLTFIN